MLKFFITVATLFLSGYYANAAPLTLKYFQSDARYEYRIALLKLAMDLTKQTDGPYIFKAYQDKVSPIRGLRLLESGEEINIVFLPATEDLEKRFSSVKIPILKGLLGYRIFLIRKEAKDNFSKITSLEELKNNYLAGFGAQWADLNILKHNQIPVITSASYKSLFTMLENNRFDYFPRGLNEAWKELEARTESHQNLMIEPNVALYYPYPVYFYVNKMNTALADRIERGLRIALRNGMFKELFLSYHNGLIQKSNLSRRYTFRLKNNTLPKDTPPLDTSWWLR